MDDYSFYGSHLRIRYGPEFESVEDLRKKVTERRDVVYARLEGDF